MMHDAFERKETFQVSPNLGLVGRFLMQMHVQKLIKCMYEDF